MYKNNFKSEKAFVVICVSANEILFKKKIPITLASDFFPSI